MNTPNFTAEASLYKTSGYYHMAGAYSQITEAYYLAREPGPPVARQPGPPKTLFHLGPLRHRRQTVGGGRPQDDLDVCCRAHDRCYGSSGPLGPCSCDLELIACAAPKMVEFWDPQKAFAAALIVGIFTTKVSHGLCSLPGVGGGGGGGGGAAVGEERCPMEDKQGGPGQGSMPADTKSGRGDGGSVSRRLPDGWPGGQHAAKR